MSDAMKTGANNDQPAWTGGQFEPETRVISQAMYVLAEEIQSGDGVANAACRQAAERLDAQTVEITRLRAALRTTQEPVAWAIFAESGAIRMWSKHHPHVKKVADAGGLKFSPLYTAPPETAPRQPLTDEQIEMLAQEHADSGFGVAGETQRISVHHFHGPDSLRNFVRAVEAAHGIGVESSAQEAKNGL